MAYCKECGAEVMAEIETIHEIVKYKGIEVPCKIYYYRCRNNHCFTNGLEKTNTNILLKTYRACECIRNIKS